MTQTKDRFRIDSFSGWLGLQLENIKPINLEFGRTEVMGKGVPVQAQFIKFERLIVQLTWKFIVLEWFVLIYMFCMLAL